MKSKSVIALSIMLALVGCGGDDSSSGGNGGDNNGDHGGGVTNPSGPELIQHWEMSKVSDEIAKVSVVDGSEVNLCGSVQEPVETEHFRVGFSAKSEKYDRNELIKAAKMAQVGFNELVEHTKLKPSDDLNITSSNNKWEVCFYDTRDGKGTAYANRMEFGPPALDVNEKNFDDSYILTKHELFHVIQTELLKDTSNFELAYWFQEGSAEYFAGRELRETTHMLHNFVDDADLTPMSIDLWIKEQNLLANPNIGSKYRQHMYDMYQRNVHYYIQQGMNIEQILTLIKDSAGFNFETAMSDLEQKLNIKTSYAELKDNVESYKANVIAELGSMEIVGQYKDDIDVDVAEISLINQETLDFDDPVASGSISRDQTKYAFLPGIPDGTYDGYVISVDDKYAYGPAPVTVKDGKIGDLDFTGVPELVD